MTTINFMNSSQQPDPQEEEKARVALLTMEEAKKECDAIREELRKHFGRSIRSRDLDREMELGERLVPLTKRIQGKL